MTTQRATRALLTVALLSTACGGGGDGDGNDDPNPLQETSPEGGEASLDFDAFDTAMSQFVADHALRGASAVLVHKDRGIVHTAGYGEFAADRIYLIMSSSKILSVGVLMRLADEGLLDIDAPIGDYVSAWGAGKSELTVAQLVSGSSGLVGIVDNLLYAPYACQGLDTETLSNCATAIYTADDAADRRPPDTEFHYGGAAWQLAGGVAEVVSGKTWAELVEETYAACNVPTLAYTSPFSLVSFMFNADGSLDISGIGYPPSVNGDPSTLPVSENPSVEGGGYTTVGDYGKILLMLLRGGMCDGTRVLSEEAVERMQLDRIASYGGSTETQLRTILADADEATMALTLDFSGYGLGWWVDRAHPGVVVDPGAFGADAWLDVPRGYGAFIAIEGNVVLGAQLGAALKPVADAVFDGG